MPHANVANAGDPSAAELARAGVYVDEREAARARQLERRRWNVSVYPLVRLLGFQLLATVVVLHGLLALEPTSWAGVAAFLVAAEVYCLLSWLALRRWFRPTTRGRPDLGDFFFATDLILWAAAIYVSGAERSWLFFVLAFRAADQAHGGTRRTLVFAHLAVLAYLGMLGWVAVVDGRPLPWPSEALKTLLLWVGGLYLALSAVPAERRRLQADVATRLSAALIRRLEARARDLSEQSRRAEALRGHAEEEAGARSRVLSQVSHEFRTPLNHIMGFVQLLKLDPLTEEQRESVTAIEKAGRRLLDVADRVVEITGGEPEADEETPTEPVALWPLMDGVLRHLRPWIEERGLAVDVGWGGSGIDAPWVYMSPRRLEQVLWNLLSNAVQHAPRGGALRVRVRPRNGRVAVEIVDPVRVVPKDSLPRLFESLDGMIGEVVAGRDGELEVAVAQALMDAAGGRVEIESGPGIGTLLRVELRRSERPLPTGTRPQAALP